MSAFSIALRFTPTQPSLNSEDRVLVGNRYYDEAHIVVNQSGNVGYYENYVFKQVGTVALQFDTSYLFDVYCDGLGAGSIWVNGALQASITSGFPTHRPNQLGNYRTAFRFETGMRFHTGLKFRGEGSIWTRPCCGTVDEYECFDREITQAEITAQQNGSSLKKMYQLSDWYLDSANDDNKITPIEKQTYYLPYWKEKYNLVDVVDDIPTAIANILSDGEYKTIATSANALSIWTPTTSGTAAFNYYTALNTMREYFFENATNGFLHSTVIGNVSDVDGELIDELIANVLSTFKILDLLISAVDSQNKANTAQTNANSYATSLDTALRTQTDRSIVFFTQSGDPSTSWTTDALKVLHKGDYWRTASSAVWKTWSGTAWAEVSDPVALNIANSKTTVWATLSAAQSSAVIGDLFLDSGLVYRATVASSSITIANSVRVSVKNWGNLSSAPASGMLANDTYYNTVDSTWYYYTGSIWTASGTSQTEITATYTPKYLGIGILSALTTSTYTAATVSTSGTITTGSSATPNKGDRLLNYDVTNVTKGIYLWSGSAWSLVTDMKYVSEAAMDICYLGIGGITFDGYTTFVTAIIKNLMVSQLQLLTGGKLFSGNGNYGNSDTPAYLGADGKFSLGSKLTFDGTNLNLTGAVTATSGSFTGTVNASSGTFNGTINATAGRFSAGIGTETGYDLFAGTNTYSVKEGTGILIITGYSVTGNAPFTHKVYRNNVFIIFYAANSPIHGSGILIREVGTSNFTAHNGTDTTSPYITFDSSIFSTSSYYLVNNVILS